ncbi:MAG TPA: hypothetical protein VF982_00665, partial [Anaerolineales bacterium]
RAQQRALALLSANDVLLRAGAQQLLAKETLDADELRPLFERLIPEGEPNPSDRPPLRVAARLKPSSGQYPSAK